MCVSYRPTCLFSWSGPYFIANKRDFLVDGFADAYFKDEVPPLTIYSRWIETTNQIQPVGYSTYYIN